MPTIAEVRAKYPQYQDMSDDQLAGALHKKFYSDMPEGEFRAKIGMGPAQLTGTVGADIAPSQGVAPGVGENVEYTPETAQQKYAAALGKVRERYYPNLSDEQWAEVAKSKAPYGGLDLVNNGLMMGLTDEVAGAANMLGGPGLFGGNDMGKTFTDFQALEQARRELGQEQQGGLGVAAEVGGALLSGRPDMAATRAVGFLPSVLQGTREAAQQGAVYGGLSTEGDLADRAGGAMRGAAVSAPFGAIFPAVAAGGRRLVSPVTAPPAKTAAAQTLQREGVELTAGQATGNKNLQYREAELGGRAAEGFMEQQADQFTSAVLRRAGINANRATSDVLDQAFTDIGQQFDDLALRNQIIPDQQIATDLVAAWRDYSGVVSQSQRAPVVQSLLRDIVAQVRTGQITGQFYQTMRSRIESLARRTSDNDLAGALRDIRAALDDAMERSISAANPGDLGAWREARRLYRNMLVIEDAAVRAGEKSADGIITPANIRSAAMRQNKRAYARGRNEFADLANAGVSSMTPLPNSGTPGRISAKMFVPAGGLAGATMGSSFGPMGTIAGGLLGAAVPWAAGRAMLSGPGRRYLGNQVAAGPGGNNASLLGALMGRGSQPLLSR